MRTVGKTNNGIRLVNGTPQIKCKHCGKETTKAIHIHICRHCNKDYRGGK